MITNLKIRKKLTQLGLTALAAVNGAMCLGCTSVEAQVEDLQSLISIATAETTDDKEVIVTATPNITEAPTVVPTDVPTQATTPEPTEAPYDPYTLTDEEAIEIGTYIHENYISKYIKNPKITFNIYASFFKKEDIINLVCVFNQKYPTLYSKGLSACKDGNLELVDNVFAFILEANMHDSLYERQNNLFPYSIFMKEGRNERKLLEELESDFRYLTDNKVSNEEIYEYWGKVLKMAINSEETFKDWDPINYYMFYYTVKSQIYYAMWCPEFFNNLKPSVPSKYVFDNGKNTDLVLEDTLFMRDTVNRSKYSNLTDDEFTAYVGCLEEYCHECFIYNQENNYIKQRIKDGN